jgi:hypothetical protein
MNRFFVFCAVAMVNVAACLAEPTSSAVLPPWTPLEYRGGAVACWGRETAFRGLLPGSIVSQGRELLAGPMTISLRVDGRERSLKAGAVQWTEQAPDRGRCSIRARDGDVEAVADWRVEYDGMMWTELTLRATEAVRLEKLAVEIPLRREVAEMLHGTGTRRRSGVVAFIKDQPLAYGRLAFLWAGNHERGLCWFAESERNWTPADPAKTVEVVPAADRVVLRLNVVGEAQMLRGDWRIAFGFFATPVKPLPRGWWMLTGDHWPPSGPSSDWKAKGLRLDCGIVWSKNYLDVLTDPFGAKPALGGHVEQGHAIGAKVVAYYAPDCLPADDPKTAAHKRSWRIEPPATFKEWPGKTYERLCDRSGWPDYLLAGIRQTVRTHHTDGVYFDGGAPRLCRNALHGCGGDLSVLATREFHKRLATMLHQEAGPGHVIYEHGSGQIWLPTMTFCTAHLDAEQYKPRKKLKVPYTQLLDAATLKAEFVATQFGIPNVFLAIPTGETPERLRADACALLAWLLPHAIPFYPRYMPPELAEGVYRVQQDFGADAAFHPYWRRPAGVSVKAAATTYVSHFAAEKRLLFCIGNTGAEPDRVELAPDANTVGIAPDARIKKVFPETAARYEGRRLVVPLEAHSFALVWLE